ncbi:hypothetical protein NE237_010157 [Protea cynaroides]|uniref:Uncharacterized protein n=1 Tax=Protea cynaroides TaxID=273540 RepID=A0A9Q0R1B8_9MAGN|nr:hypothetical protein NE237_010157 [Protea cynaroides]
MRKIRREIGAAEAMAEKRIIAVLGSNSDKSKVSDSVNPAQVGGNNTAINSAAVDGPEILMKVPIGPDPVTLEHAGNLLSALAIVEPWDGSPTAMFSLSQSPSSIEQIPIATMPPFSCSGGAAGYMNEDYSSSDEERQEEEWFASKNSISTSVGAPENYQEWGFKEPRPPHSFPC